MNILLSKGVRQYEQSKKIITQIDRVYELRTEKKAKDFTSNKTGGMETKVMGTENWQG